MLQNLRAIVRLIVFFVLSLATVLTVALGRLTIGLLHGPSGIRWKNMIIRLWATLTAKVIGLKINKEGDPPEPPFFLVSNHLSYIDVIPLWKFLDGTFIAKREVKSWPFFGWGTKILGVLFIDRDNMHDAFRMNRQIANAISDVQGVILFPEGTSTKGEQVLPFNAPLLKYPASREMPVHYATLTYRSEEEQRPAHRHICWWGDMEFLPHFWDLLKMSEFEVDIRFGDKTVTEQDRKKLAEALHKSVATDFLPVVKKQPQKPQSEGYTDEE